MTNLDYLDFVFKSIHYNTAKLTSLSSTTTSTTMMMLMMSGSNNSSVVKLKSEDTETTNEKTSAAAAAGFHTGLMSPPILLVGTNKNGLAKLSSRNELIRKKFEHIREFISNKIYSNHIFEPYFAIENMDNVVNISLSASLSSSNKETSPRERTETIKTNLSVVDGNLGAEKEYSDDLELLKRYIQIAALSEPYMGEQQPLKWMNFDKSLEKLKNKGLFYASLSQVCSFSC